MMYETEIRVVAMREIDRMAYMDEVRFASELCELLKVAVEVHFNICKKCIDFVDFFTDPDDAHIDCDCTIIMSNIDFVRCYRKVILSPWFRKAKGLKVLLEYEKPIMRPVGRPRIELILDDESQAAFDAERQRIHEYYMTHQCSSD